MPKLVALLGALATTVMAGSGRNGHSHFKKNLPQCDRCCVKETILFKYADLLQGAGKVPLRRRMQEELQLGNMWIQAVNQNCDNVDLPLVPMPPMEGEGSP